MEENRESPNEAEEETEEQSDRLTCLTKGHVRANEQVPT